MTVTLGSDLSFGSGHQVAEEQRSWPSRKVSLCTHISVCIGPYKAAQKINTNTSASTLFFNSTNDPFLDTWPFMALVVDGYWIWDTA